MAVKQPVIFLYGPISANKPMNTVDATKAIIFKKLISNPNIVNFNLDFGSF